MPSWVAGEHRRAERKGDAGSPVDVVMTVFRAKRECMNFSPKLREMKRIACDELFIERFLRGIYT